MASTHSPASHPSAIFSLTPHCESMVNVNYANFSLSLFILIGILVSYLPQHFRIIRLRTSYGLSPYFVLLGTTSGTCAFANILTLPESRADMACCRELDGFACFAGLLGIAQVGVQWSCFGVILLLFLIFFPRGHTPIPIRSSKDPRDAIPASFRTALLVTLTAVLHAVLVAILSFYFVYLSPEHLHGWADFLGILATVLASIQYFPQIYTTWSIGRVGSLSIPMMCIQTPGSFVWAASLAARLGPGAWSAWGVYCVTGCLQGALLGMSIYFEIMHRRREKKALQERMEDANASYEGLEDETTEFGEEAEEVENEETPLLQRD